ncbi:hypothetical protein [Ferdinandcohnia sp. Marseille-Q9671]
MSSSILFHRVLDDQLFQKIGYMPQPLKGCYINELFEEIDLSIEPLEGQEKVYQLADPKVHWDPDIHNLILSQEIVIANPMFLFNTGGLVTSDSVIGVALRWYSKDSSQYNVFPAGEISYSDVSNKVININVEIPEGNLRGKVTFDIVLYLAKQGLSMKNAVAGTILGVLENKQIIFDGESSIFPIVEVNDPKKPLWWVTCDIDEPLYDRFTEDNVAIVINTGHKNSRLLKIEKGIGSSPILMEIIATGLQIIIEKVKESGDWQQILTNKSEPGSIGQAIYYFVNTFNWDVTSPENLAKSIREDFDKRF